jgi:hypothetical protein
VWSFCCSSDPPIDVLTTEAPLAAHFERRQLFVLRHGVDGLIGDLHHKQHSSVVQSTAAASKDYQTYERKTLHARLLDSIDGLVFSILQR